MRATLNLPDNLVQEAMKIAHTKTKTKVIILALEEFIRKSNISDLKKYKGKVDLKIIKSGTAKGLIKIMNDFDEPLEDFKGYM